MSRRLVKILFVAAIVLLLAKSGVSAALFLWPKNTVDNSGGEAALELIKLTNAHRQNIGLAELAINPRLTQAAISKAKDILSKQYFSHTSPSGRKFSDWIKDVNYAYFYVGENLAIDFTNPADIFAAWIKSPKHRENIERPESQEIGIADLKGKFDGRTTDVVVQLFGSRVLGANEQSTNTPNSLANNYFSSQNLDDSIKSYFAMIDRQLNYWLGGVILLFVFLLIYRWRRKKKLPPDEAAEYGSVSNVVKKIIPKRSAPPLVSLYTKRILTANADPKKSKNISQPDSRKKPKR